MRARFSGLVCLLIVAFSGSGCQDGVLEDGKNDGFVADGKTDFHGVGEGTAESCGVLAFVSDASADDLADRAGLGPHAIDAILDYRLGPDSVADTYDDERFDSLAELDSVSYVGPLAFGRLLEYVEESGQVCRTLDLQILGFSDWHGQLDPSSVYGVGDVGGAAVLATLLGQDRKANPNTLVLGGGDSFGASPPLSSFFDERPTVLAMNLLGVDADNPGNHGFDRGVAHLQSMIELAEFPLVAANLAHVDANMTCQSQGRSSCIEPYELIFVGGVKVAVIGIMTPELPDLVKPGSLGSIVVTDPVAAAMQAREAAAADGAQVFVASAHLGGAKDAEGMPYGALIELANQLDGFDMILGGHTHTPLIAVVDGAPVVETDTKALTYARVGLTYDFAARAVVDHSAELVTPAAEGVTLDSRIVELLAPYRDELSQAFDGPVAISDGIYERGAGAERTREMPIGNLVADALRARYGTQLVIVNGGGLRSPLPSSYAPRDLGLRRPAEGYAAGPPYDVVVGDAYSVLPFGNDVVTKTITGSDLWAALEHSVEGLPEPKGWFAQISGFCFELDSSRPAGSRVVSVTLGNGTPIAADGTVYTLATSDFIAAGGDGYTMLAGADGVARDKMAEVLLDYIRELGALRPEPDGRITDLANP